MCLTNINFLAIFLIFVSHRGSFVMRVQLCFSENILKQSFAHSLETIDRSFECTV